MEYLLRINHAGFEFTTGGIAENATTGTTVSIGTNGYDNNNRTNKELTRNDSAVKRIKPRLWATILERAYNKSDQVYGSMYVSKCATFRILLGCSNKIVRIVQVLTRIIPLYRASLVLRYCCYCYCYCYCKTRTKATNRIRLICSTVVRIMIKKCKTLTAPH